jgi:hypothetical protein
MSRKLARIAVNRAKLNADLPAIRVTRNGVTRHARTVKVLGPCAVMQVRVRGKSLALVVTESELELLK